MNNTILFLLMLSLIIFTSCGSQKTTEKKVEKKIQSETVLKRSDVTESAREYILKSETLSDLQKKNLLSLLDKSSAELKSLSEENNKSKLVLIKTFLQHPKINENEVLILNRKIRKLSKKRMDLDFKTFADARRIIDPLKELRDREFLYNSFMLRHGYYW